MAEVGSKAPDFTLVNQDRESVTLSKELAKGSVVLAFFPGAFSGTCTKEFCTFRDTMSNFRSVKANVLGISTDTFFALKAWDDQQKLGFPLLSDYNKEAIHAYGVVNPDMIGLKNIAKRAVFVIDKERSRPLPRSAGGCPERTRLREAERGRPEALATKNVACAVCEIHAESVFKIDGMDCREEVAILERRLKPLPGLEDLVPDLVGQRLRVRYDAAKLSTAAIVDAVAQTGMRAWLEHEQPVGYSPAATARQTLVMASGAALAAGLFLEFADFPTAVVRATYLISILTGGIYTARRAWAATRVLALDINVLMLVAVAGAIAILGEWSEGATVTFLFAFAQILEARSMDRARNAIRALMDLTPPEAIVRRNGHESRLQVDDVRIGDVLLVKPGDKIPLDGIVVAGSSPVNQAPITGESLPVEKANGDVVYAGTINGYGGLDVRVTHLRPGHDAGANYRARRDGAIAARAEPGIRGAVREATTRPRSSASRLPLP